MSYAHNKAFKSDSQRLAVSLRSSIAKRRSHLNAALCDWAKIFYISLSRSLWQSVFGVVNLALSA
ncbi:hypothetical protein FCU94_12405 [Vibrio sp. JPW-9-11-11]|nr:hypothetical protein [Vibrio sp. JPW-9-11-11]